MKRGTGSKTSRVSPGQQREVTQEDNDGDEELPHNCDDGIYDVHLER
jgi:hypothetical protein